MVLWFFLPRTDRLLNACGRKEYKLLRVLVEVVKEDREKQRKDKRESDILSKLMTMSEINENTGQYEQQITGTKDFKRANHPTTEMSPPTKMIKRESEGQGV